MVNTWEICVLYYRWCIIIKKFRRKKKSCQRSLNNYWLIIACAIHGYLFCPIFSFNLNAYLDAYVIFQLNGLTKGVCETIIYVQIPVHLTRLSLNFSYEKHITSKSWLINEFFFRLPRFLSSPKNRGKFNALRPGRPGHWFKATFDRVSTSWKFVSRH
jgi:hypothetical protein